MSSNPVCSKCHNATTAQYVEIAGKILHPECFKCGVCATALGGKRYVSHADGSFCEPCYHKKYSPHCGHCDERLEGPRLEAMGKFWHEGHFVCSFDGMPFPGDQFHIFNDHPYCKQHLDIVQADTCGACNKPIVGKKQYEALGSKFHVECFKCKHNGHQIKDGDMYLEYEGQLFCQTHLQEKLSEKCDHCKKPLLSAYLKIGDRKLHNECFFCCDCRVVITADTCEMRNHLNQITFHCKNCTKQRKAGKVLLEDGKWVERRLAKKKLGAEWDPWSEEYEGPQPGVELCYTYEALLDKDNLPPHVRHYNRERFLSDEHFKGIFRISKKEFQKLPQWRRLEMKKIVNLF